MHDRLGRIRAVDERDRRFPLAEILPARIERSYRFWWAYGSVLDQTGPTCVANAWTAFLLDSPRTHRLAELDVDHVDYTSTHSGECGYRRYLYDQAQATDEWHKTPPESRTSVRDSVNVSQ